ncbi:MAG: type II secretion system protein [Sedimentisphaerales bacterium]|nr:type II secretion system protein [Sedimentisphaerales bacterium]
MTGQKNRQRGFMMTELIVSMTVFATLLIAFAISLDGFKRLNSFNLVKQRAISAAQANLDSIAATGAPVDPNDLSRLWPGMTIKIDESKGLGQWKGLNLVTVTAQAMSFNKKVEISLSRYFDNSVPRLSALQEK